MPLSSAVAICGGLDGNVRFTNLSSLSCIHVIHASEYSSSSSTLSHINKVAIKDKSLAVCGHSWIRLHALDKLDSPATLFEGGHSHNVTSISFQSDSKWFVTTGEDGKLRIWDFRAKGYQLGLTNGSAINCGSIHPNQGTVVFGDQDGFVNYFDLAANKVMKRQICEGSGFGVVTCDFDAYNRLITCCDAKSVSVYSGLETSAESGDTASDELEGCDDSADDASPRHALMPPAMIPLISRSVSNNRTTKCNTTQPAHQTITISNGPPPNHRFAMDTHPESYLTSVSLSGRGSTRHPAVLVCGSDASFSVWRTSHDDNYDTLDSHISIPPSAAWCWDARFVDEKTRFVLAAFSDGKCRLWDTLRPSSSPIAVFDGGFGKGVRSIVVLSQDALVLPEKRFR